MQGYLKVVVTGEVDSGKSTLIGRFLYEMDSLSEGVIEEIQNVCQRLGTDFEFAYLLDSFEEERKNQLTIDTTQVFCNAKRGNRFIFIDVPGHVELLKNMLCGSSYADIAMLVVDIGKSVEEQTGRHAFILKLLGIEQIILALNKMDSVNFDEKTFRKVKENITGLFKKIEIEQRCFIPISARQGDNLCKRAKKMPWYKGPSLLEALNTCPIKKMSDDFRFLVQDVYNLDGKKVAAGEIISGIIKERDLVKTLPLNKKCKVETISVFNKNKSLAKTSESVGLILDDMKGIKRGLIICKDKPPHVKTEFLTKIFCVHPLDRKDGLLFRCAVQESPAQIKQINRVWDTASLEPKSKEFPLKETDIAEAIIVTEYPVVIEKFKGFNKLGRFVLRNNAEICAVGVIC